MKVIWWTGAALAVAASIAAALLLRSWGLGVPVQTLVLALGVAVAALAGRTAGVASSAVVVLAFNYWFTEPLFSLLVDDPQSYLIFLLFLILGSVVGTLTSRVRRLTRESALQGFSHDLRTPLTVISGTAATLRSALAARGEELAALSVIERETLDLDRQVDNLLALNRLQSRGGWSLVLVPAEELLFSSRDRYVSWGGRTAEVESIDTIPLVKVEPSLVEQALLNLVVNAEKHADRAPLLSLAVLGKSVELRVGDRGPGVRDSEKHAVFARFKRGSNARGRGTGLGLALVGEIARLHGGEAGVRDRAGGGAEFYIRLPLARGPHD